MNFLDYVASHELPLGQNSPMSTDYAPQLLCPIPRSIKRDELKIGSTLPFFGFDTWNAYELSWLNPQGKPLVAIGRFDFPVDSPYLIESKSLKLYLNSLYNTVFLNQSAVEQCIQQDLSYTAGSAVKVTICQVNEKEQQSLQQTNGICLDALEVVCEYYQPHPEYLTLLNDTSIVSESLYSNILKSNCPVTGQPDLASIWIHYRGYPIVHERLLQYIVSFRNHQDFHEHCIERIFMDIMQRCQPELLTVEARYTRRGGLDINPIRSSENISISTNIRMLRQ